MKESVLLTGGEQSFFLESFASSIILSLARAFLSFIARALKIMELDKKRFQQKDCTSFDSNRMTVHSSSMDG